MTLNSISFIFNELDDLTDHIANLLTKEKVIGWYQNSSEWGQELLVTDQLLLTLE